ncbi:MAG: phosphotransferase family protein, partial [Chloroflexota bacterium]
MLLLIPRGGKSRAMVVKVASTDAAATAVRREQMVLRSVQGLELGEVRPTVPRIVGEAWSGRPALLLSGLPGTPMSSLYHRWRHTARPDRVAADFAAVGDWLAAFQKATAGQRRPLEMDAGVCSAIRLRFEGEPGLDGDLARLEGLFGWLRIHTTPQSAVHGDLWCGNVLVDHGRVLGVVDWELGTFRGEPVRDLVRFPLTYALYLDRHTAPGHLVAGHPGLRAGRWGAGIEYAAFGEGWFPALFRRFLQAGLERLGAPTRLWADVLLAGLAEVAANADHQGFAHQHWELFRRLSARRGPTSWQ